MILLWIAIVAIIVLIIREIIKSKAIKHFDKKRNELINRMINRKKTAIEYINNDHTDSQWEIIRWTEESIKQEKKQIEFVEEFLDYDKNTIGKIMLHSKKQN